jgi:sugar/nucleoside kinase (ribokinase family)
MDVLTIGEVLVEFVRKGKGFSHRTIGEYAGPFPSGAPAIFADTAARLGLESGIAGSVGRDDFGALLTKRLSDDNVKTTCLLINHKYATGTAFVTYYSTGERAFVYNLKHSAAAQLRSSDIGQDFVRSARALLIMGSTLTLGHTMREACYKAVRIASKSGIIIVYDPNVRTELTEPKLMRKISSPVLNAAEIVMPSKKELLDLTGRKTLEEAADYVFNYGVKCLILKLGQEGSVAMTKQGCTFEPAYDVHEVDPTGAGDAFDAAALYCYLRDDPLDTLLDFANAVGALKAMRVGPMEVPGSLSEVTAFMRESSKRQSRGMIAPEEL